MTLLRKNQSRESFPSRLADIGLAEEILILTEQHASEARRLIKQLTVIDLTKVHFLSRDDINSTTLQTDDDSQFHMHIHEIFHVHFNNPIARSLRLAGEF